MKNNLFNKKIQQGIEDVHKIALSQSEKARVRELLLSYVDSHAPVQSVPSPYWTVFSWQQISRNSFAYASIAALFLIVLGGGASLAAESSIPGDTLYPMKISITEPLRTVLTVDPVEKAKWEVQLTDRRLSEAESLDDSGRLDNSESTRIKQKIESHENNLKKLENQVEKTTGKKAADDVRANFEKRKSEHRAVIEKIRSQTEVKIERQKEAKEASKKTKKDKKESENTRENSDKKESKEENKNDRED